MKSSLIAVVVVTAFALPLAAVAAGDKSSSASPSDASGAESMFKSMDKNNDGSISREEAKGSPHEKEFAALDKNHDGKLSREEHAASPGHAGEKRPATTSSSAPARSGGK